MPKSTPKTANELATSLAALLAERAVLKARQRTIAIKIKRIRAALDRHPSVTIAQPMDSTPDPFADLDSILGDE